MTAQTQVKEEDVTIYYPAPNPGPLSWKSDEKYQRNKKAAQEMLCDTYFISGTEYILSHGFALYHIILDREVGACSCPDFTYRSGQAATPCKHLIKIRETPAKQILRLPTSHAYKIDEWCKAKGIECRISPDVPGETHKLPPIKLPPIAFRLLRNILEYPYVPESTPNTETTKITHKRISGGENPPSGNLPYKCREPGCDAAISEEQAIQTFEKYGKALCKAHELVLSRARSTVREILSQPKTKDTGPEIRDLEVLTKNMLEETSLEDVFLLFQQTPERFIKHRPGRGGREIAYVEGWYLKQVLNMATKWQWSSHIEGMKETPTEVIVWGSVTITMPDDSQHTQSAFGSSEIHLRKDNGKPVSLGDDYKAAATDMIKKAISQWGISSDVYRQEVD